MTLADDLQAGLAGLGMDLPASVRDKLLAFVALLKKWNRTYNLTAISDEAAMLSHHVLDSLAVVAAVDREVMSGRWADVGSGAGLPAIPIAVACPEIEMTSIESVEKKAAFQRQAKIELGLANLTVEQRRVEQVEGGSFDAVISRAFAELADFVRLAGHLLKPGGRLYAMKGALHDSELEAIPPGWTLIDTLPLHVPGLDARRHLLILGRN